MSNRKFLDRIYLIYDKVGIWLLSLAVISLNVSLAFDNVVWGDEAYSQMAIRNCTLYGIFERTYYWDSHPPLYYYYLRLFADLFGYRTPVYHAASLVPFIIGILFACTLLKKHFGTVPATFFILVSGFSESCAEYNLEIRMYSLLFLFVLLCAYSAYLILKDGSKICPWIFMTLFGVLAAYTHYYGVALCGLLLFFTGLFHFLENRKKSWIKGFLCVCIYALAYSPWLSVLYFQTKAELNNSWLSEPEALESVLRFISGGRHLYPVVFRFIVVMSILVLVKESGAIAVKKGGEKHAYLVTFAKPGAEGLSVGARAILLYWVVGIFLLLFAYGVSNLFHPILARRYAYALIPLVLLIFMLCMGKLLSYMSYEGLRKPIMVLVACMLFLTLVFGLLDFKYYRSVCKTQEVQTNRVLEIVGTPKEDAVLCSNGVQHLAWSVLTYYYPDHEVTLKNPNELDTEPSEIWAFIGYEFDEDVLTDMTDKGYKTDAYFDLWLGKYGINLYHFYK